MSKSQNKDCCRRFYPVDTGSNGCRCILDRMFKTVVTFVCDVLLVCEYLEACEEGCEPYGA